MEISKFKPFNNKITLKDNLKFIIPSIVGILLFITVSYTHLDVYKRQS